MRSDAGSALIDANRKQSAGRTLTAPARLSAEDVAFDARDHRSSPVEGVRLRMLACAWLLSVRDPKGRPMSGTCSDHDCQSPAQQDADSDAGVIACLPCEEWDYPWTVDEIAREMQKPLDVADSVDGWSAQGCCTAAASSSGPRAPRGTPPGWTSASPDPTNSAITEAVANPAPRLAKVGSAAAKCASDLARTVATMTGLGPRPYPVRFFM